MASQPWMDERDRIVAALGVVAVHAVLAALLLLGLAGRPLKPEETGSLKTFNLPPPPRPQARPKRAPSRPKGQASAQLAPASTVPKPVLVLPVPEIPAGGPVATPKSAGMGSATAGAGTGAGGEGAGTGGAPASRARQIKGRITNADYPRTARRNGAEGTVGVMFNVGPEGRAHDCAIVQSSGSADLDNITCRLIEHRFRYEPARDAQGQAVPDRMAGQQSWWMER